MNASRSSTYLIKLLIVGAAAFFAAIYFLPMLTDRMTTGEAAPAIELTAEEARAQAIQNSFSALMGYHHGLRRYIRDGMNDPGSFQHVETRYREIDDTLLVTMVYRGRNAFGGTVTQTATAIVDLNGRVLELISNE
jgi:hypothetical protein